MGGRASAARLFVSVCNVKGQKPVHPLQIETTAWALLVCLNL